MSVIERNKIFVLSAVLLVLSCASRRELVRENNYSKKDGAIALWASWIKDKGNKFDLQLHIENLSDKPIIIMLADIRCTKGTMNGTVKHTFFNTGEKTIDFTPGEHKAFNMVCRLGADVTGPYGIRVARVLENPSGDGKNPGKVIATDISWKLE